MGNIRVQATINSSRVLHLDGLRRIRNAMRRSLMYWKFLRFIAAKYLSRARK